MSSSLNFRNCYFEYNFVAYSEANLAQIQHQHQHPIEKANLFETDINNIIISYCEERNYREETELEAFYRGIDIQNRSASYPYVPEEDPHFEDILYLSDIQTKIDCYFLSNSLSELQVRFVELYNLFEYNIRELSPAPLNSVDIDTIQHLLKEQYQNIKGDKNCDSIAEFHSTESNKAFLKRDKDENFQYTAGTFIITFWDSNNGNDTFVTLSGIEGSISFIAVHH